MVFFLKNLEYSWNWMLVEKQKVSRSSSQDEICEVWGIKGIRQEKLILICATANPFGKQQRRDNEIRDDSIVSSGGTLN